MLTLEMLGDMYPKADTIQKAFGFISCAAKQGRMQIRIRANHGISVQLELLGFDCRRFDNPDNYTDEFTVSWNP